MSQSTTSQSTTFRRQGLRLLALREASILAVAILLFVYFAVTNGNFISNANLVTLSQFIAPAAIIASGEVMLLICGEIDLSVGQVYALAPFIMAFTAKAGLTIGLGIVFGLAVAALVGLINGLITVKLRVPSFVTTLGMLFLINGLTLTISNGYPVNTPGGPLVANVLGAYGYTEFGWAVLVVLIMHMVLRHRPWGLHTVAVGGNLIGATEAGIDEAKIKVGNFMLTSMLGGLTGILEAFRIGSTDPLAGGTKIMFLAVASGVIGGTRLAGGSGTVMGALIGAIVLGTLQDGFTLAGISAFTFDIIIGGAILLAMIANIRVETMRRGMRR